MNKKFLFIFIILLAMAALLTACEPPSGGDNNGEDDPPIIEEPPIYDLTYLNYNPNYFNPEKPGEKGYILYDYIDFNTLRYTVAVNKNPYFNISYGGKIVETVQKPLGGTVYSNYTFNKTGEYEIGVVLPGAGANGSVLTGSFTVNVRGCGYPDRVDFELSDKDGSIVDKVKGGETFYITAKTFSDGVLIGQDTDKFTSFWHGGQTGERVLEAVIPNLTEDAELEFNFGYECILNNYTRSENAKFTVPAENNYAGLIFNYGGAFSDGVGNINIAEIPGNFTEDITAFHSFLNDETGEITVGNTLDRQEGNLYVFIKYNGEAEYQKYIRGIYNPQDGGNFYLSAGIDYQFNTGKSSADIYLAMCYKENFTGGYNYKYRKIENSDARINIVKTLSVAEIYGEEYNGSGYTPFSGREVNNGEVTVRKVDYAAPFGAEHQHFKLKAYLGGFLLGQSGYTFTIDNSEGGQIVYDQEDEYFYALTEGVSYITLVSTENSAEFRLKIVVE